MEGRTPGYLECKFLEGSWTEAIDLEWQNFPWNEDRLFLEHLSVATDLLGDQFCISQSTCQFSDTNFLTQNHQFLQDGTQPRNFLPEFCTEWEQRDFSYRVMGMLKKVRAVLLGKAVWMLVGCRRTSSSSFNFLPSSHLCLHSQAPSVIPGLRCGNRNPTSNGRRTEKSRADLQHGAIS